MRYFRILTPIAAVLGSSVCYAGSAEVDQVGQKFSQSTLSVPRGDAVHFVNHDDVTHNINVIDEDDNALDKGLQKPGETIEQHFDKAGKFIVRCSIHPKMKMTVAVK